jgi:hypothetical protein
MMFLWIILVGGVGMILYGIIIRDNGTINGTIGSDSIADGNDSGDGGGDGGGD